LLRGERDDRRCVTPRRRRRRHLTRQRQILPLPI
jgi:hypothetical protein